MQGRQKPQESQQEQKIPATAGMLAAAGARATAGTAEIVETPRTEGTSTAVGSWQYQGV